MSKQTFVNVEFKLPWEKSVRKRYDWRPAVQQVFNLIQEFDLKEHCCISSFFEKPLLEMMSISAANLFKVRTV